MTLSSTPKVSIGMPVYNGEQFLAEALESILAQTFNDFELVICDNASTDATEEICRGYVAQDQRIRYFRQSENIGAAGNYNDCFRRARGKFFKWAAHDDKIAPGFIKACLARLEADHSVAVAFAQMREIDALGLTIGDYDAPILWQGRSSATRVESLLCSPSNRTYIHRCVPITGLMRTEMLRRTRLIGRFGHADKVALVELALLGDFAEIPEPLFFRRIHPGVSLAANTTPASLVHWFDPKKRARIVTPHSRLFREYVHAVLRTPVAPPEKLACMRSLIHVFRRDWRIMGGEIKRALWHATTNQP